MKTAFWIWTGLCAAVVALAFLATPGWYTDADGWELFSGAEVFVAIALLIGAAWLVGLGILAIVALVAAIVVPASGRRRAKAQSACIEFRISEDVL